MICSYEYGYLYSVSHKNLLYLLSAIYFERETSPNMQRGGNFGQKGHLRCPFYMIACSVTKYVSIFVTFAIYF